MSTPTPAGRPSVREVGKLSAADLNVMLDVFYDHRTLFDGLESEGSSADLWQHLDQGSGRSILPAKAVIAGTCWA